MNITIRKRWLISFWIFFIFYILSVLHLGSLDLISKSIVAVIPCYITYHYSYKKKGSKWLLWLIFIVPLNLARNLSDEYNKYFLKLLNSENYLELSLYLIYAILTLSISLNFVYWCYQLRKINLNAKTYVFKNSAKIQQYLSKEN